MTQPSTASTGSDGRTYLRHERTIVIRCKGRGRASAELGEEHPLTKCGRLHFSWIEDVETGETSEPSPRVRGTNFRTVYHFDDGRQVPLVDETTPDVLEERRRREESVPEEWRRGDSPAARAFQEAAQVPTHHVDVFECRRCAPPLRIDLRDLRIDVQSEELRAVLAAPGVSTILLRDLIDRFSR